MQGLLCRLRPWHARSRRLVDAVVNVGEGQRSEVYPTSMRIDDVPLALQVSGADRVDGGVSVLTFIQAGKRSSDDPGEVLAPVSWLLLGQDVDLQDLAVDEGVQLGDVFDDDSIIFQTYEWFEAGIHLEGILGVHHPLSKKEDDISFSVFDFQHDPACVQAVELEGDDDCPLISPRPLAKVQLQVQVQEQVVGFDEEESLELRHRQLLW